MSAYMTEEEQLENMKRWWRKYNKFFTPLLLGILALVLGYKYWVWHDYKVNREASSTYEKLVAAFSNPEDPAVQSYANQLISEYPSSVYAEVARLVLAKISVSKQDYKKAKEWLESLPKGKSVFKQIATIRHARLLIEEKNYTAALLELDQLDSAIYSPVVNELKGDIYMRMDKHNEAMSSYKAALEELDNLKLDNTFLRMKMQHLEPKKSSVD